MVAFHQLTRPFLWIPIVFPRRAAILTEELLDYLRARLERHLPSNSGGESDPSSSSSSPSSAASGPSAPSSKPSSKSRNHNNHSSDEPSLTSQLNLFLNPSSGDAWDMRTTQGTVWLGFAGVYTFFRYTALQGKLKQQKKAGTAGTSDSVQHNKFGMHYLEEAVSVALFLKCQIFALVDFPIE